MRQATTLAALALVATLGGVVGTQLGRDAIAEIDPIFFSEKPEPSTFYADYSSTPSTPGMPNAAPADAGWGYLTRRRGPVCWGCPEEPDPFVDPFIDPADAPIPTAGRAVVRMVEDEPSDAGTDPRTRSSDVERYASFPVTEEEATRLRHIVELQRDRSGPMFGDATGGMEQPVGM